jgi:hypothetical protein
MPGCLGGAAREAVRLASLGVTTSGVSQRASLTCPYDLLAWPRTIPPTVAAHRRKPQLRRRAITCFAEHRGPDPLRPKGWRPSSRQTGPDHRPPREFRDEEASLDRRRYLHMTNLLPVFYYLEVR